MEYKRVSFKVAKAIKKAGYNEPCDMYYHIYDVEYESDISLEMTGDGSHSFLNSRNHHRCAAPSALDVWLWLWRERGIELDVEYNHKRLSWYCWYEDIPLGKNCNDPEEAIIAAIEYLGDNDLIK